MIDDPRQHPRRPALCVNALGLDQLFQQADLIICVQNREIGFQPDQFGMAAQQFNADRMERAKPRHTFGRMTKGRADAFAHLARGFIGEGYGQNTARRGAACEDQMCNPRGQGAGFARACAR